MELQRTVDGAGNIFQWVEEERVMIVDRVTGEPIMFGSSRDTMGSMEEALQEVARRIGEEERLAIVRLDCVVGYPVEEGRA